MYTKLRKSKLQEISNFFDEMHEKVKIDAILLIQKWWHPMYKVL